MRRVIGIGFIFVILFNTVGCLYLLNWRQHDLRRKAAELIDSHASEISGNLIFALPMAGPYATDSEHYTRVDGEIEFEGTSYRMVKQKVQANILYVVCVKDERTRIATEEINEIIRRVAGRPMKDPSGGIKAGSLLLKFCFASWPSRIAESNGWVRKVVFGNTRDSYVYECIATPFHPPSFI